MKMFCDTAFVLAHESKGKMIFARKPYETANLFACEELVAIVTITQCIMYKNKTVCRVRIWVMKARSGVDHLSLSSYAEYRSSFLLLCESHSFCAKNWMTLARYAQYIANQQTFANFEISDLKRNKIKSIYTVVSSWKVPECF